MSKTSSVKSGYRALPIFLFMLIALAIFEFVPNVFEHLRAYYSYADTPLDSFGEHGWYLYLLFLPFIGMCIADIERLWPFIVGYAILPIAICLSYWLWEWLGWCVLGFALLVIAMSVLVMVGDDYNEILWITMCVCIAYLIARVILYYVNEELLHPLDIIASCALCIPPSITACKVYFEKNPNAYKKTEIFAYSNNIYSIVFCLLILVGAFVFNNNNFYKFNVQRAKPSQIEKIATTPYVCTASVLNIRSYAAASAPSVGRLKKGDVVNVLYISGGFAKIEYEDRIGYVSAKHIKQRE